MRFAARIGEDIAERGAVAGDEFDQGPLPVITGAIGITQDGGARFRVGFAGPRREGRTLGVIGLTGADHGHDAQEPLVAEQRIDALLRPGCASEHEEEQDSGVELPVVAVSTRG